MRSHYYDVDFRDRAGKIRTWGLLLLALAAILWVWCAMLLMLPYEADTTDCKAPLFTERATANTGDYGSRCAKERDWPEVLAVLGASIPVSVAGGSLFTIGTVSRRMSAHGQAIRELDKLEDTPKE